MSIFSMENWRQHVALDVGTATTRIAVGSSQLLERPSRTGATSALAHGVVVDAEAACQLLRPLLERSRVFGMVKPCVLACAPSDARHDERQRLLDAIMTGGAASVSLVPEPLAAAIGAGLDVSSPYGQMIVDIGEGVSDCAVIRSGRIYATCAVRGGCSGMRRAIVDAAAATGATCDEARADALLRDCGIGPPTDRPDGIAAVAALTPVIADLAATIDSFLRELPHEVGCEIIESGICLTGGGALIPGFRGYLEERTGISVVRARNPQTAVVEGGRSILPVVLMLNRWK